MNTRALKGIVTLLVAAGAVVALNTSATAAPAQVDAATGMSSSAADQRLATRLVNRFFTLLHDQDVAALTVFVSPAFQVQRPDGTGTDKAGYLAAPPKVDAYEISGLIGTRAGDTVVARYFVTASETINGQVLKKDPAPRLSVFKKNAASGSWQLVAHANFNAVPTTT
jgi:hypothetical protein